MTVVLFTNIVPHMFLSIHNIKYVVTEISPQTEPTKFIAIDHFNKLHLFVSGTSPVFVSNKTSHIPVGNEISVSPSNTIHVFNNDVPEIVLHSTKPLEPETSLTITCKTSETYQTRCQKIYVKLR